ncbi:peptidoglycan DD-metalloendopeptidase family protein [Candidatus Parcubacteria bacterium]|nr:peptidoglycan DD-metalloendopeptidase family protein [Candidatus Parcubacteria bacterium]
MKKILKFFSLFIVLILISFAIFSDNFVFGQGDSVRINKEVKKINGEIEDRKNAVKRMQRKQQEYSDIIEQKQSEKMDLNSQIAILNNKMAKTELNIEMAEIEIDKTELEIKRTDIKIKDKKKDITREKNHLTNVLKLMNEKDKVTSLEILLMNNSLADFLSQAKYLENVNDSMKKSIDDLNKLKRNLEEEKEKLNEQNKKLDEKRSTLKEKKKQLAIEKENQEYILEQINKSEAEFQRLIINAKKEQENAASEIVNMEKMVREKLAKLENDKLEFNDNGLIWPVPKNVVTTYFHDPDYPFRHIFEHPGIDVRAGQGTPLRAAASGYVARTKDNGMGYSYIMIIHGDGLSTVYGHISKIQIKQDEYVVQGQKIGLTGGMPGTPGAGRLTTGPHLHFETRLNGIPTNPLKYLK